MRFLSTLKPLLAVLLLCLPLAGHGIEWRGTEGVPVSAINYTGNDLNAFLFENPDDSKKVAGGVGLDPYSGGGTMCCYRLPKRWHKGIKVKLRYDWWTGSSDDRRYQYLTVELPRYPTREPGILWVVFHEDGSVEIFASAVDPGHEKWPGKIKHWPVPSREYKLKLWQMDYDKEVHMIPIYEHMSEGYSPQALEEQWRFNLEWSKEDNAGFSGSDDPRFAEAVRKEGMKGLASVRQRLADLEKIKP